MENINIWLGKNFWSYISMVDGRSSGPPMPSQSVGLIYFLKRTRVRSKTKSFVQNG